MVKISMQSLSEAALCGVIDDFVLREGTDYGSSETSLERKRIQVRAQLESGDAQIWFDPHTESVTIRLAQFDPESSSD